MTLESISIEGLKPQDQPHQAPFPSLTVTPVVDGSNGLPGLENFLKQMNAAGLFGPISQFQ